ncbi:MAG: beta-lactamase family protein [Candidatus Muirbacterium halophilum]|nr:beta-lactamase family protein [Candidatus Muirbacterium halophilum]MCK9476024.1 beta-lactamase family protein [Candidatus Muirbacterium halophilum]
MYNFNKIKFHLSTFSISLLVILILNLNPITIYTQNINKNITDIIKTYSIASLQVISINKDQIIYKESYGKKNIESNINTDCNTLYRVASLSKLFTTLGILKLIDKEKLTLEDDISQYFDQKIRNPYFPEIPIQIKHLLTHTSGIIESNGPYKHFIKNIYQKGSISITDYITPKSPYYTKNIWKNKTSTFNYSNYTYGLLATIIEKISKQNFDNFIEENILKPLKIEGNFNIQKIKNKQNIGILYKWTQNTHKPILDTPEMLNNTNNTVEDYITGTNALIFSPQGGLRTNITGLGNLLKALIQQNNKLLSAKTFQTLHTTAWKNPNMKGIYKEKAAGIHITEELIKNERLYGHSGESFGMTSCLYYSIEKQKGFAFIVIGGNYKTGKSGFYEHEEKLAELLF